MTEPIRPDDVPDELVDDAVDAWHDAPRNEHGLVLLDDHMRHVLAAVAPGIERQVREKVAREIEAAAPECTVLTGAQTVHRAQGMHDAARIARGVAR